MGGFNRFIFDVDGTLTDTAKATVIACREGAEKLGLPPPSLGQVRAAMGYPGLEYYQVLLGNIDEKIILEFQKIVDEAEDREIKNTKGDILFPGVKEALKSLKNRGIPLFIASTGSAEHINLLVDISGIRSFFMEIYYGRPRKIEMTAEILSKAGPGKWVFAGDRIIDAQAAQGNNIPSIGALYGYCTEPHLFDLTVRNPAEFLNLAD